MTGKSNAVIITIVMIAAYVTINGFPGTVLWHSECLRAHAGGKPSPQTMTSDHRTNTFLSVLQTGASQKKLGVE